MEGFNKTIQPFRTSSYDLTHFGLAKLRQVSFGDGLVLPKNLEISHIEEESKEPSPNSIEQNFQSSKQQSNNKNFSENNEELNKLNPF